MQRTKLLIVDDLRENLLALTRIIEQDDREIYQASSGEAALALLLEHDFALAILDVMMPDMNGFELAELMRGTEKTRHIPIVFVSAGGKELNYAFKGYETGAVDFLHKPLDIAAVKSKVNVFVSLYQQRIKVKQQVEALEQSQRELHATQLELERALKMRDDFMSLVAHELRTPLNTLHLETQVRRVRLQREDIAAFNKESLNSMVERDSRQIQSMIRLINDMVDVSRATTGTLSIRPGSVNLAQLVTRIVGDFSQQAHLAGCCFRLDPVPEVIGEWDEFRVEQVLVNLITNALRYGGGKPVKISFSLTDDYVEIHVQDQGAGIPESEQQRIFEKFERLGNNQVKEGLGMGLYIARQLAEAHGGKLTVRNTPGSGACFTLCLPFTHKQD
ncbi:hybrid sensor histidine kinase/response regulator [Cellvibrio mixtus]|uniref:hybrid sensor histidine kinase/response regulator n=1 Tax=Cellvibrio mixtus TaxID=39650 RepID=UPI00058735CE|nr:hybrid sensor histidine kinase/response regulator [Cellvibrio mixtus]